MRKFSVCGMVMGGFLVLFGIIMLVIASNISFSTPYISDTSFGGDFYTYQYRATRHAAENVSELGELIESVSTSTFTMGGFMAIIFGVIIICYFGCKMQSVEMEHDYETENAYTGNNVMPTNAPYVQNNVNPYPNQNNNAMAEKKAKLDGLLAKGLISREDYDNAMKN